MSKYCPTCQKRYPDELSECEQCREVLLPVKEVDLIGRTIDNRYRILRLLGKGGMGVVYVARQTFLEREVALKVLKSDMAGDQAFVKRFLQEARAVARLRNPHTITVHDFGTTEDGLLYFSMELLKGKALSAIIKARGRLDFDYAAQILVQTCESLAEAHSAGILHRDLKPDNIFVSQDKAGRPFVTVLDFGIAKALDSQEKLTATGMVCGTPHYLSPEQATGGELDGRADIYSLGVILFEMLTGVPPFDGDQPIQVLMRQIQEHPKPLVEVCPDVDVRPGVQELLDRLLAKAASKRPADVGELAATVEKLRRGGGKKPDVEVDPFEETGGPRDTIDELLPPDPRVKEPGEGAQDPAVQPTVPVDVETGVLHWSPPGRKPWIWVAAATGALVLGLLIWSPWREAPPRSDAPPVKAELPLVSPDDTDARVLADNPSGDQIKDVTEQARDLTEQAPEEVSAPEQDVHPKESLKDAPGTPGDLVAPAPVDAQPGIQPDVIAPVSAADVAAPVPAADVAAPVDVADKVQDAGVSPRKGGKGGRKNPGNPDRSGSRGENNSRDSSGSKAGPGSRDGSEKSPGGTDAADKAGAPGSKDLFKLDKVQTEDQYKKDLFNLDKVPTP